MQIQTANSRGAVVSALQAMVKGAWVLRVERPSLSSSLWLSLSSSASSHLFAVSIIKPALARLRAHMHAHTQVRTTASPRQGISGAEADQLWMWSSCLLFCSWGGEQTRMNFYPSPLKSLISAPVSYHFSLFEGQFILKNIKLLKKKKTRIPSLVWWWISVNLKVSHESWEMFNCCHWQWHCPLVHIKKGFTL